MAHLRLPATHGGAASSLHMLVAVVGGGSFGWLRNKPTQQFACAPPPAMILSLPPLIGPIAPLLPPPIGKKPHCPRSTSPSSRGPPPQHAYCSSSLGHPAAAQRAPHPPLAGHPQTVATGCAKPGRPPRPIPNQFPAITSASAVDRLPPSSRRQLKSTRNPAQLDFSQQQHNNKGQQPKEFLCGRRIVQRKTAQMPPERTRTAPHISRFCKNAQRKGFALAAACSLLLQVCVGQLSPPRTSNFKCLPNGCCDQHEWCRFWASIGECRANAEWMAENCQLACATCRLPGSQQAPAVPAPAPSPKVPSPTSASRERTAAITTTARAFSNSREQTTSTAQNTHAPVAAAGSCEEIARHPQSAAEQLAKSGLLNPVEDVGTRQTLSLDDITRAVGSGCVPELSPLDCSPTLCFHLAYRSMDGTCNNLQRPLLGASFRPYIRHLPAEYDNGFSEPASSMTARRPSPREASRLLLASAQVVAHDQLNSLMMQWGQFMSHDMARTTLQPTANCGTCDPIPSKCVPVSISDKDTNDGFRQKGCLKISRSAPVCGTGHQGKAREQLNENTAFVDGSQIYGSSIKDLHKFRDGRTGMLKLSRFNNLMVLPFDEAKCTSASSCAASFVAGDIRANLFLGLSSMHILFAREHNRIARTLQGLNAGWSGDRLFQEARKIVGAEIQAILYREFLPRVLGSTFDKLLGTYKGYDPQVDPTVSNEFTTSAYRFGHGMILEQYPRLAENGQPIAEGPFLFGDGVFKSQKILFEGGVDPVLRGLWNTPVKRPHRMTPAITERMFGTTDLGSLNIMRGREHGIPSYNKWRRFCGMDPVTSFDQLKEQILDENVRKALAANYPSPDDLDLYVGGMVEDPVVGGMVGSTLACIIGDQFKRTRDGDRFYFENPGIFTEAQLIELKKTSLSRILCDNGDRITEVPAQAFALPRAGGGLVPCSGLAQIDLTKWRE